MRNVAALALYAITLAVSAALLFFMEPMIAKMLLPLLGGSPGVWNTCMVFFQLALLLGYLYAHIISTRLNVRQQIILHACVISLPLLFLPVAIAGRVAPPPQEGQIVWLFCTLTVAIGLPFFAVCTTSPLLQKWFANLSLSTSPDPYFLFSASNLGSLFGLIAYPFLIEPRWTLSQQSSYWQTGYLALLILTALCALTHLSARESNGESAIDHNTSSRAPSQSQSKSMRCAAEGEACYSEKVHKQAEETALPAADSESGASGNAERIVTPLRRIWWLILAAIPSSLVLGLTTFCTTRMASFPLLWMLPLAVYLLSIILAFARIPAFVCRLFEALMPWLIVISFINVTTSGIGHSMIDVLIALPLQLFTLFVISLTLHARVAGDRPHTRFLTEYYLLFSLGGVLGSAFNALLAPMIFSSPYEYPLVLGAAGLVLIRGPVSKRSWSIDKMIPSWALPALVAFVTFLLFSDPHRALHSSDASLAWVIADQTWRVLLPLVIALFLGRTKLQTECSVAAVIVMSTFVGDLDKHPVYRSRNFFGITTVLLNRSDNTALLVNDFTTHGTQSMDPQLRHEPTTYYSRSGPLGRVLSKMFGPPDSSQTSSASLRKLPPFAIVGLGAGTCAAYAKPGQNMDLYEINPTVIKVATDPLYFTYLFSAYKRGVKMNFLVGDARIQMQAAPDDGYGIIILDAFSDDIVPLHLLTREALDLYLRKLAPGGILAYHCSSNYYDIVSAIWNLVTDANLHAAVCYDEYYDPKRPLRLGSIWMLVAEDKRTFDQLELGKQWLNSPLKARPHEAVWTDDYHNPLGFIKATQGPYQKLSK
ncbi:MAG TPA: fused MFS/spermidine synthase [Candidatus Obscuribacterales bacterium]